MQRNNYLLRKYGITHEQYESLLNDQGRLCAICQRPADGQRTKFALDHDHHSGEIRGVLCSYCNRYRVGRSRREHVGLIQRIASYLDRDYTGWIVPPKRKKRRGRKRKTKALLRKQKQLYCIDTIEL